VAGVNSLVGRRILIVGGGTRDIGDPDAPPGNGRAVAIAAAREGAEVAVTDIDERAAQVTAELAAAEGPAAYHRVSDAASPQAGVDAVSWAGDVLGGLDGLVLNVGIGAGRGITGTSVEDWDNVFAVNVRCTSSPCRPLCPRWVRVRRRCSSPRSPGFVRAAASRRTTPRRRSRSG
jgi:NAD(P)-dependent dehydrogenase (short-subunit alcohol dehydrogenase family)